VNPVLKATLIVIPIWFVVAVFALRGFVWLLKYNTEAYQEYEDCEEHPACQVVNTR
jgi:hypothetical protein